MIINNDPYGFKTPLSSLSGEIQQKNQPNINQDISKIEINRDQVEININNYPSQYDVGYRNPKDFITEYSQKSLQTGLGAIGQKAQIGDILMEFQENDITDVVKLEQEIKQKEVGLSYRRSPEFEVNPGGLHIDFRY